MADNRTSNEDAPGTDRGQDPDRLGTLLGRAYAEERGCPRLSVPEGRAVDLFPDARVRELAAVLGHPPEELAGPLARWALRGVREHGLDPAGPAGRCRGRRGPAPDARASGRGKKAHARLDALAEALAAARDATKRARGALAVLPAPARALLEAGLRGHRIAAGGRGVEVPLGLAGAADGLWRFHAFAGLLAGAAAAAAGRARPPAGAPRDEDRRALTRGLADIYEELTGARPTWGNHPTRGGPSTAFGRLCEAALGGLYSAKIARSVCAERKRTVVDKK